MLSLFIRLGVPLALGTCAALAQSPRNNARADPLDAAASVPAPKYESSFSQYRRLGDEKPLSWREANDTVSRIGGWRVYAREARQPDAASSAPPSAKPAQPTPEAKPTPAPAGHGGHKTP